MRLKIVSLVAYSVTRSKAPRRHLAAIHRTTDARRRAPERQCPLTRSRIEVTIYQARYRYELRGSYSPCSMKIVCVRILLSPLFALFLSESRIPALPFHRALVKHASWVTRHVRCDQRTSRVLVDTVVVDMVRDTSYWGAHSRPIATKDQRVLFVLYLSRSV